MISRDIKRIKKQIKPINYNRISRDIRSDSRDMEKLKEKIRLSDVARLAGVSRSAAGKVLNGCSGDIRVGADTRKRIEDAARRLNYRTNMAAAMLAGRESNLIGVIADTQTYFRNRQLLQEIEQVAHKYHYRMIVSFMHDNIPDIQISCNAMQRYGVCGIICLAHDYPQFRKEVEKVFRDTENIIFLEKPHFNTSAWVGTSILKALTKLFGKLKQSGRKKIALVHGSTLYSSESTLVEEYRKALVANDYEFYPELLGCFPQGCTDCEACEFVIENMIKKEKPDALYVDDATFALCIQSRLQYESWRIPEALLLAGGNGDPLFSHAMPPIISLNPHYELLAEALVQAIVQKKFDTPQIIESTFDFEEEWSSGT